MPIDLGQLKAGANAGQIVGAIQRAHFALQQQRSKDAELIAGEVLRIDPRNVQALHIAGYALLMQERTADAIALLEPAARTQRDPEIDVQLALALRQAGRDEDAVARLKRATKRRPVFPPAFFELGDLLFAMKRYEDAAEALEEGLEVAPMPELSIRLGQVFLTLRNYERAKSAFTRTLAMAPNAANALWGLGKTYQSLGENKHAAEYFRRALALSPGDPGILLNLGHSLLEIGELDAGYDCFRQAAAGDRNRYAAALATLVKAGRGRFWLKPSAAAKFLLGETR